MRVEGKQDITRRMTEAESEEQNKTHAGSYRESNLLICSNMKETIFTVVPYTLQTINYRLFYNIYVYVYKLLLTCHEEYNEC